MLLFWLIDFTFFTHASASCPGNYVPSEESSSCIKLFTTDGHKYSWDEARDLCRLDGSDLVKIVNQAMNDFIYDMAMSDTDFLNQDCRYTWIGLNDPNSDNTWVWLDEEDQAAWTNWSTNQPDNTNQDCAVLDTDYSGEWRDLSCDSGWSMDSYICETPALTTTIATTTTTMSTSTAVTTVTTPKILTSTTTSSPVVTREASSGGLSVAVIAGIVIGVLVVVALVPAAFLTIRYFRNRQRTGHSHTDHSVAYTNGLGDREATVIVG